MVLRRVAGPEPFRFERDGIIAAAYQGGEVYGDDYPRALSGAKIGIGFLRRVCPDQHTTRTFEIPACGSMLLAERTAEHQDFFEDGREAEFFESREELVDKARFYCCHEPARRAIAAAGYRRCVDGQYAYVHRMRMALTKIQAA
jgi:spore maturation protein CgeB